ncbi:hypothetical protein HPB48_009346 [Haemaphysalis longicornis]|uniref:SKP1 component POZ domain-containing protein n=1 Tax=Haemaphysalis longicornis TaxID=44386 RepID=A0A9J6FFP0_HAELO|nr:hypothetical protein HPB48_009346 [Haemaphysalis longicornis]
MPYIPIEGSDGSICYVDVEFTNACGALEIALDDLCMAGGEGKVVALPNVKSEILSKVIEWATSGKGDKPLPEDDAPLTGISPRKRKFLDVDKSTLVDLILATNYLRLLSLLHGPTKIVADMIKAKIPAEILDTCYILDGFPGNTAESATKPEKENVASDAW